MNESDFNTIIKNHKILSLILIQIFFSLFFLGLLEFGFVLVQFFSKHFSKHMKFQTATDKNDSSASEGMLDEGRVVTVRSLLKGLYEKACQQKLWGLVRHTAGMLGKRVEDLAKAITDLLVRQKQVSSLPCDTIGRK